MFESAEIGHKIADDEFKKRIGPLREALLDLQFELDERKPFPVILVIAGASGSGKGTTINTLVNWMDPRKIHSFALDRPTDEERERPYMWRFWRELPPRGRLGVFFGSWYTQPVSRNIETGDRATFDQRIDEIVRFERMLANEGALILKVWLHLSKKEQGKRLKALESDPATAWRVRPDDWVQHKNHKAIISAWQHAIRLTNTAAAPWIAVDASDENYRMLTVAEMLRHQLETRLRAPERPRFSIAAEPMPALDGKELLASVDLSKRLDKDEYKKRLAKLQARLNALSRDDRFAGRAAAVVFEGNDAAGKGGAIRRVVSALDARFYDVVRIGAPTEEEKLYPYLWRFWRRMPRLGRFTIFDRSWYGRVLVERVEGYAEKADWLRAYGEINDFEHELHGHGIILAKFWLTISQEEQAKRFSERQATGFKRFKITDDDWRNRDKWPQYEKAVTDMVDRTSSGAAPWTLVPAEDKRYARVTILETLCDRIEDALDRQGKKKQIGRNGK